MSLRVVAAAALGVVGFLGAVSGIAAQGRQDLGHRAILPNVTTAEEPTPTPTPTPRPPVYDGQVSALHLTSARVGGNSPLETRDTHFVNGREVFEDPSRPQYIATYPRWGKPGHGGLNSVFAAHVNYVGYGNGPFAYLHEAKLDDALYVTMDNGLVYTYTVKSIAIVPLAELDMDAVVFPPLDDHTERVTLISCGGTFIPAAYGGEYTSRVILVAERYVP